MLGTLEDDKKADWKLYVAPLVHAYSATRHKSTGYNPYYLIFGWYPLLSTDVVRDESEETVGICQQD